MGMVLGSWGATKYLPGGHITFLGINLKNCFTTIIIIRVFLFKIYNNFTNICNCKIRNFLIIFLI